VSVPEPPVAPVPEQAVPELAVPELAASQVATPQPATPQPANTESDGPLGSLVAAHFQRLEVAMLSRVLTTTLAGALPPSMVRVERRRSLAERLLGRPGHPIGISVIADDETLTFRAPHLGVTEATISHTVRGVVLSSTRTTVAEWLSHLADVLNKTTSDDQATRIALQRILS
ncbi:MAG: hypothetical protein M3N95_13170, partial [Actinomycetota bacterium]|nr:hypothetical protein [Actinomycetota bacterium]